MKKNVLSVLVMVVFTVTTTYAQVDVASEQHSALGQVKSENENVKNQSNRHPDAQWFPTAGFGLFIHLGMSAVHGGIDLSWGMCANKPWLDGEITPEEYWALADVWNPKRFNADKIVKTAKKAGFKYVVFTTKHHDGYTMWPSKYGDFGVKQKLGGRDLVREFVDACRKNDMKIGLYFSPPDWRYDAVYRNWDHSKKKILDVRHQPLKELPKKPEGHDEKRRELAANQVRELLTEYGKIDIMWFDGGRGEISNDEVRRLQPGIIINKRNGNGGDFGNTEGRLPKKRFVGWFETNDPCWPSSWWGYSASNRMDTGAEVIEKLVTLRAWGGNFLANVGPKADGSIPEEALEAWKEIGKWMKHSGESVYDVTGGPYPEKANQPVTIKGENVMYVHAFPNCQHDIIVKEVLRKPMRALLLRTGEDVPFSFENQTLTVKIPAMQRTRMVDTVKLILDDM